MSLLRLTTTDSGLITLLGHSKIDERNHVVSYSTIGMRTTAGIEYWEAVSVPVKIADHMAIGEKITLLICNEKYVQAAMLQDGRVIEKINLPSGFFNTGTFLLAAMTLVLIPVWVLGAAIERTVQKKMIQSKIEKFKKKRED